jgi:hypothetical protein
MRSGALTASSFETTPTTDERYGDAMNYDYSYDLRRWVARKLEAKDREIEELRRRLAQFEEQQLVEIAKLGT